MKYTIEDTPCYPCRWKIVATGYRPNNSWTEFFPSRGEAEAEIQRREKLEDKL